MNRMELKAKFQKIGVDVWRICVKAFTFIII